MAIECDETNGAGPQKPAAYEVATDETVSMAVVDAVASATDRHPVGMDGVTDALDPLAESIDPEALDQVFRSGSTCAAGAIVVEFEYCGRQVTVRGADSVCVTVA